MWQEQHCSIVLTENLSEVHTTLRALDRPSTWSSAGKWEATDMTYEMFRETIPQTLIIQLSSVVTGDRTHNLLAVRHKALTTTRDPSVMWNYRTMKTTERWSLQHLCLFAFSLPLSSVCTCHRRVFMSVRQTFAFLPRRHLFLSEASAFIRIKCHGSFLSSPSFPVSSKKQSFLSVQTVAIRTPNLPTFLKVHYL